MRCCRRVALSASGFLPPDRNASNFNCRWMSKAKKFRIALYLFCAHECGKTWFFERPSFTRIARRRCSLACTSEMAANTKKQRRNKIPHPIYCASPPPPTYFRMYDQKWRGGMYESESRSRGAALLISKKRYFGEFLEISKFDPISRIWQECKLNHETLQLGYLSLITAIRLEERVRGETADRIPFNSLLSFFQW